MDRVRGLDGVRGFASLCIVGFHVLYFGDYLGSSKSADALFLRGDCFVRLFFMLSGFSLMCAYHKRFCDGKFDIATYLKRRAIRILPCFLLVELAYIFINMYAGNPNSVYEIIGTTSMLFALFPTGQDSIVAAGWSTGIQVAFYLLFPAFLVACKTRKSTWFSFVVCGILLYAYTGFYGVGVPSPHINIVRHLIYFVSGALLFHYKDELAHCSGGRRICIGVLCLAVEVGCLFTFGKVNEDITMLMAFSALITLQILGGGTDPLMRLPIFAWLGTISYEIYLFHPLVYVILGMCTAKSGMRIDGYYVHLSLVLGLSIVLANVFHRLFPMLQQQCVSLFFTKNSKDRGE